MLSLLMGSHQLSERLADVEHFAQPLLPHLGLELALDAFTHDSSEFARILLTRARAAVREVLMPVVASALGFP